MMVYRSMVVKIYILYTQSSEKIYILLMEGIYLMRIK